ncbi:MAG: hypothetical protein JWR90_2855 [Marmoricola sp.]|nr:hypothetical protein [Marmoricola sp.]
MPAVTAPPHPDVPPWRSRLASALGAVALLLIVLSIVDVGDPWTFVAAAVAALAMLLLDGSLLRWWRRGAGRTRG